MNISVLAGRLCTVPQLSIISLEGKTVCACKFVIAVCDGIFDYEDDVKKRSIDEKADFFQCVAFVKAASMINGNFMKGSKIICTGDFRNHKFEDANGTKHFTNIFLVHQAEFGDTEAVIKKFMGKKKSPEMTIISDLRELENAYESACNEGFLCLDENDYYKIAMNYM